MNIALSVLTIYAAVLCMLFPATINARECHSLDDLLWLPGSWVIEGDNKTIRETWHRTGARTWEGVTETRVRGSGELQSVENIRLVEMTGQVFYIAKVSENEYPVPFKLTACSERRAVFENPHHDFPRKLVYHLKKHNLLDVHVSDGEDKGFSLTFTRQDRSSTE